MLWLILTTLQSGQERLKEALSVGEKPQAEVGGRLTACAAPSYQFT